MSKPNYPARSRPSSRPSMHQIVDSGKREDFDTGSVRDTDDGKGQPSRLSTIALRELAQHTQNGLQKYGDRNWEKGQPLTRYIDSLNRHIWKIQEGANDENHYAAVLWNAMALLHTKRLTERGALSIELDDLHEYTGYTDGTAGREANATRT